MTDLCAKALRRFCHRWATRSASDVQHWGPVVWVRMDVRLAALGKDKKRFLVGYQPMSLHQPHRSSPSERLSRGPQCGGVIWCRNVQSCDDNLGND